MKNNYSFTGIFFLILILFSCNAQTKQDSATENDGTNFNQEFSQLSINIDSIILNKAQLWKNTWASFDSFNLTTVKKIDLNEKSSTSENLEKYSNFLIYSPDSLSVIDLYSYNMDLIIADEDTLVTFDIDSEASLINVETEDRNKILFFGSSGGFDDAFWLNNNEFIIVGYQELYSEDSDTYTYVPMVWYFDLIKKEISKFEGTSNNNINSNYFGLRYPTVKME